jgi:hypothetical protein
VSVLKKGVRFTSQDTNSPMTEDEVPFVVHNLTPAGIRCAAAFGIWDMCRQGFSINQALEILGGKPKEKQ